jgi:hypothetical protein
MPRITRVQYINNSFAEAFEDIINRFSSEFQDLGNNETAKKSIIKSYCDSTRKFLKGMIRCGKK